MILVYKYLEKLETLLRENNVKSFKSLQFNDLEIIGRGGSAIVYSAMFNEEKYVLKCLNNNLHFDNKTFKKFIHELKILNAIDHPNIIRFYGISRDPKTSNFMMVLQFANGGNLRDYLNSKQKEVQRPTLDTILTELEKLSADTSVRFIINDIGNKGESNKISTNTIKYSSLIQEVGFYDYNEFSEFSKIGEGGYGQVERAYWKTKRSIVALKSLKVKMNSNEKIIEEFFREPKLQSIIILILINFME
ncbi:25140_t:CDS:2 [Dentiscutata erythropus]|uniref:25140_t:CDS:1 n=1 Tax=Dentiscutata erythropus TaxID=1348616 RepID=A0A9N8WMA4_9GLOM|nr:25140_t:CDS:2 [Dentiscutata erythropus]